MKALGFTPEEGMEVEIHVSGRTLSINGIVYLQPGDGRLLRLGAPEKIDFLVGSLAEVAVRGFLLSTPSGWYVTKVSTGGGGVIQLTWADQKTPMQGIVSAVAVN